NDSRKRMIMEVMAIHNGDYDTDADFVDYISFSKLKTANFSGLIISVNLMGAGNDQMMQLCLSSPNISVNACVIREDIIALE
ncbi:MAG: hypothetical protein ABW007_02970, partial [Chitinophagaceae bacterium]